MSLDECSVSVCVWHCVALLDTPNVCVAFVLMGTCRRAGWVRFLQGSCQLLWVPDVKCVRVDSGRWALV